MCIYCNSAVSAHIISVEQGEDWSPGVSAYVMGGALHVEAAADEWNTRYAGVTNLPITVHDIRHCPLCKNDSFWVREHFNDDEELLRCAGCGNDYLWRRPTKEGQ